MTFPQPGASARRDAAGLAATASVGAHRTRVIATLAAVLGLSGADFASVGATAAELREALGVSDTDIGLLVTASSLVAALATIPFGMVADRLRRTWTLAAAVVLWGLAMVWSATVGSFDELLLARLALGAVTAAAGPIVASLIGDYFPALERGRIYGYILLGELLGTGLGFALAGNLAALSWRTAFLALGVATVPLAVLVARLPEPPRAGQAGLSLDPAEGGGGAQDRGTEAQPLARARQIRPHQARALRGDGRRLSLAEAVHYVLAIRTNLILIAASACGYYFLAGVQTFGLEFVRDQYRIDQVQATLLLLVAGAGALGGSLISGALADTLLERHRVDARIVVSAAATVAATVLFLPALFMTSATLAALVLLPAVLALSAQNPSLDAARLDIVPPSLWGRAEGVRTFLRSIAQAVAPLLFGVVSDNVFGGGRSGLQWTFVVMLVPLGVSAALLWRARRTYPGDAATAALAAEREAAAR